MVRSDREKGEVVAGSSGIRKQAPKARAARRAHLASCQQCLGLDLHQGYRYCADDILCAHYALKAAPNAHSLPEARQPALLCDDRT